MNNQFPRDPREKYEQDMRNYHPGVEVDPSYVSPQVQKVLRGYPPEQAYKKAASNFYMIAALSIINSVVANMGGSFVFVIVLGITQLVDALAYIFGRNIPEARTVIIAIGIFIDLGICGIVVLFGYLTSRRMNWPLITGMVLYGLDAGLTLLFKDWIGFAFHLFFLWQIWVNYNAIRLWKKMNSSKTDSFPQNIGTS